MFWGKETPFFRVLAVLETAVSWNSRTSLTVQVSLLSILSHRWEYKERPDHLMILPQCPDQLPYPCFLLPAHMASQLGAPQSASCFHPSLVLPYAGSCGCWGWRLELSSVFSFCFQGFLLIRSLL